MPPSRVLLRVSLTGLLKRHSFVSFRFFSFLFHTLKRTREGGSAQDTTRKRKGKGYAAAPLTGSFEGSVPSLGKEPLKEKGSIFLFSNLLGLFFSPFFLLRKDKICPHGSFLLYARFFCKGRDTTCVPSAHKGYDPQNNRCGGKLPPSRDGFYVEGILNKVY